MNVTDLESEQEIGSEDTFTKELREFMLEKAEETSLGQKNGSKKQYRYGGALKRKISEALAELKELSLSERQEAFRLVEELLT